MKKIIALALALIMSLSCFTVVSFAEGTDTTAEHLTEVPEGYVGVYTVDDLYNVNQKLSANYILMNDIDLSKSTAEGGDYNFEGRGWNPIGADSSDSFSGIFDGNNYSITGMNIAKLPENVKPVGLFKSLSGTIKNLNVTGKIDITDSVSVRPDAGTSVSVSVSIGGIVGVGSTYSTITNCTSGVTINADIYCSISNANGGNSSTCNIGGISGSNQGIIEKSANYAHINADMSCWPRGYLKVGGVSGSVNIGSTEPRFKSCLNSGNITASGDSNTTVRATGISNQGNSQNCFNVGRISSTGSSSGVTMSDSTYSGRASYCYNVGEIVRIEPSSNTSALAIAASNSYTYSNYFLEGFGEGRTGSTALTDSQMKTQSSYSGWDFETVWTMEGREDYPYPELRDVPLVFPEELVHKHEYTSEVTKEATHLEEGEMTYTCECGDGYTEAIAKLTTHIYETVVTEPTCTAQGYTTYTCECGDSYVDDYTDKLDHEYTSEITTQPTHLTEGVKTFTCECGDSYTELVAKLEGHTYISEVTKEATHLEEGVTTFTCACGDTYTEKIEKLAKHTYEKVVTAPTCTAKGYTTYTCQCGDSYTGDYVSEKGHSFSENWTVITTANCSQDGVAIRTCRNCSLTETDITPAFGHSDKDGDNKCDECSVVISIPENSGNTEGSGETTIIVEKDNVFTFLRNFLNTLIEFLRSLLKI